MKFLEYRKKGYELLKGSGLEIGAFEHPAVLPLGCTVKYLDVISKEEAQSIFPEVDTSLLKEVDYIWDISKEGLQSLDKASLDFIIINHVLEHLPNPIWVLRELNSILKTGGHLVMAIPDKKYTFDKLRPLTAFAELENRFRKDVNETVPEDYRDMVTYVHPELLLFEEDHIYKHLESFKRRSEHVNVWDSDSFQVFVKKSFGLLNVNMSQIYEVTADQNDFEYFGVFKKN